MLCTARPPSPSMRSQTRSLMRGCSKLCGSEGSVRGTGRCPRVPKDDGLAGLAVLGGCRSRGGGRAIGRGTSQGQTRLLCCDAQQHLLQRPTNGAPAQCMQRSAAQCSHRLTAGRRAGWSSRRKNCPSKLLTPHGAHMCRNPPPPAAPRPRPPEPHATRMCASVHRCCRRCRWRPQ